MNYEIILWNARLARTCLARMWPYCNDKQMLCMYKALVWSALEVSNVCYLHACDTELARLDSFQNLCLQQLCLPVGAVDSIFVRRKVAYLAMVYKQVVSK